MSFQISRQAFRANATAPVGGGLPDAAIPGLGRPPMSRISMSLPEKLLSSVDRLVVRRGLPSRSHAISMVLRQYMSEQSRSEPDEILIATVTIIYTERYEVHRQLCELRQRHRGEILSQTTLQLEAEQTLEMLIVRAPAARLMDLQTGVARVRGVAFGKVQLIADHTEVGCAGIVTT